VLWLAGEEADDLEHEHIGTEHLLLGLLGEGEGVAMRILLESDATPIEIRAVVMARVSGPG
jgi:ATP-dependent Clp protease ATP-binding subunit ClpA